MSDPRRPTPVTPLFDSLCLEFAARELTDERLKHWLEEWGA